MTPREDPSALDPALLSAVTTRHRPERPSGLANVLTFAWRALLKIKHMPEQLFDVVVTPVMFTVLFTYLFGGALVGSTTDYLHFLLPGILVQTVMFTSVYTGFTLNTDLSKGIFDRFRSMPLWRPAPIVGAMAGDTVRYTASALIVFAVGLIMGFRPGTGVIGVIASILLLDLFAVGMSWIFMTLALIVRAPNTVMTLSWLFLMPLTFASNIFVDPKTMPGWLQAFVAVNPVALLVSAIRSVLDGTATVDGVATALIAPAVVFALFGPLSVVLYQRER